MRGKRKRDYFFYILSVFIATLVLMILPQPGEAHILDVIHSGYGTAVVDGVLSPGEWHSAGSIDFNVNTPGGGIVAGRFSVMNDQDNLYLAIWFDFVAEVNNAFILFDNSHNGVIDPGDDAIGVSSGLFYDETRVLRPEGGPYAPCCNWELDQNIGGTIDGEGVMLNNTGDTVYEFSHPLDSADNNHDFNLTPGDTVGFDLDIRLIRPPYQWPDDYGDTGYPTWQLDNQAWYADIIIAEPVIEVPIDIKPGSTPNSINLGSAGVIPVAILSTEDFDATDVIPESVSLAGASVKLVGSGKPLIHFEDVNGDNITDVVCQIETVQFILEPGESTVILEAELYSGERIMGTDTVNIVP